MSEQLQWLVGPHAVSGALANDPERIEQMVVAVNRPNAKLRDLLAEAEQRGIAVRKMAADKLEKLVGSSHHQGIAVQYQAASGLSETALLELIAAQIDAGAAPLILALDEVQDPRNLGACLRSAEAAGVMAVVTPKHRAAALTPAARKAAAGGAEVVPVVQAGNLARCLRSIADLGVWLTGLAGEGEQSIYDVDFRPPSMILAGNEEKGLRRLTREHCDHLVRIPMVGSVSSLNVSVAASIALFEALRQRGNVPH